MDLMKYLLFYILLINSIFAQTLPPINPLSKYLLKAVNSIFSTEKEVKNSLTPIGSENQCRPKSSQEKGNAQTNGVKSWPEAKKYFTCFAKHQLDEKQIQIIKIASKHFGVNDIMMACLFLMESRFDSKAQSAFASGIAQFTPATLKTIKAWNTMPSNASITACNKDLSPAEKIYCKKIKARAKYSLHLEKLNKTLSKSGIIPGGIKFDLWDKYSSIVLSTMYMKKLIENVRFRTKPFSRSSDSFESEMKIVKMALAGYNMGEGNVNSKIRKLKKKNQKIDLSMALKEVKSVSAESAGHMDGIERCIRDKNFEGPTSKERYQEC